MFVYIRVPPNNPIDACAPRLGPRLSLFSKVGYMLPYFVSFWLNGWNTVLGLETERDHITSFDGAVTSLWPQKVVFRTQIYSARTKLKLISDQARDFGRDPFNQNSNRSDREKRTTSKGGPVFSKLFRLDRTDPLSFGPKFPEILVEWIAPFVKNCFEGRRACVPFKTARLHPGSWINRLSEESLHAMIYVEKARVIDRE